MKIAVTGASGLIGSSLVGRLKQAGDEVIRIGRQVRVPGSGDVQRNPSGHEIRPRWKA